MGICEKMVVKAIIKEKWLLVLEQKDTRCCYKTPAAIQKRHEYLYRCVVYVCNFGSLFIFCFFVRFALMTTKGCNAHQHTFHTQQPSRLQHTCSEIYALATWGYCTVKSCCLCLDCLRLSNSLRYLSNLLYVCQSVYLFYLQHKLATAVRFSTTSGRV